MAIKIILIITQIIQIHFNSTFLSQSTQIITCKHSNVSSSKKTHSQQNHNKIIIERLNRIMKQKQQIKIRQMFKDFVDRRISRASSKLFHQSIEQQQPNSHQSQETPLSQEEEQELFWNSAQQSQQQADEQLQEDGFEMSINDYIMSLSPAEKRMFKKENPDLPDTYFMTAKEKANYFNSKNNNFKKNLHKTPQRKSKTNKKVQFLDKFQYKPFTQEQKVSLIKKAKQYHEKYDNQIHFS